MRYKPARGGHAPGHLRDEFCDWLDRAQSRPGLATPAPSHRFRHLWNCTDILPGTHCNDLDLPPGSTYAQAVRLLDRNTKAQELREEYLAGLALERERVERAVAEIRSRYETVAS
jgi:hypothetical protein